MHSLWQWLDRLSHALTPAALTTLLALFAAVPLHMPGLNQLMPGLVLIAVYYWSLFYPGALPYLFLFLLGLLEDALAGNPLGLSSLVNLLVALLAGNERFVFGKMLFRSVWLSFIAIALVAGVLQWSMMSLYTGRVQSIGAHALQWGITCLAYPLVHAMFTWIYRKGAVAMKQASRGL